ncbi:MAG: NAD(P)H-dependent oxidoreductase [Candidatus Nanopelagicales bacterium]
MPRIAVIMSTTRQGRFAEGPAAWVLHRLGSFPDIEVDLIDLRDFDIPHYDGTAPARNPRMYSSAALESFGKRIDAADGFIILTAEYNHSYPSVLKNAMDHTFVEWHHKPVSFIGWGGVGGARAIEQLRLVAVEFEMAPLRHAVHILPDVLREAMTAKDKTDPALYASLDARFDAMMVDLQWWTKALATARGAS